METCTVHAAVTLYGATGRIRGWRLINSAGGLRNGFSNEDKRDEEQTTPGTKESCSQQGIALLETLIAIVVLMIGLLAVLATFAMAIGNTTSVQHDSMARQKAAKPWRAFSRRAKPARSRLTRYRTWAAGNGIFTVGFTPMTDPGPGWFGQHRRRCCRRSCPDCRDRAESSLTLPLTCWLTWVISPVRFRSQTCRQSERSTDYGHRTLSGAAGLDQDLPAAGFDFFVPLRGEKMRSTREQNPRLQPGGIADRHGPGPDRSGRHRRSCSRAEWTRPAGKPVI